MVASVLTIAAAGTLGAQGTGNPADPIAARIQQLVSQGDPATARRVADSVLANSDGTDPRHGEALFWRASLTVSPDSARRDLLLFVVDYPFSARMEDALIRLADIEMQGGDRASARRHLERMAHDYLVTERGARAARQLADMLFSDGAALAACDVIDSARTRVPAGNVELANQLAYSGRACEQVRIPTQPLVPTPRAPEQADSAPTSRVAAPKSAPSRRGSEWSVQVAAYAVRGDALRLAAKLTARGYDTRITGDKPYRVRIGRFQDRAAAAAIVARLKAEKTAAIIVEAERK